MKLASGELIVCGDQWPMLVYTNQEYDPEDPWNGLFKSQLLIWVSSVHSCATYIFITSSNWTGVQAHLHLTQLHGEGSESNQIQQCSDTWHEASHHGFPSIRSNTSAFSVEIPSLHH